MTGNSFTFHGPVSGQIVNIGSTLTKVTQTISGMDQCAADEKQELLRLIAELKEELAKVPAEQAEQAEAISALTKEAVDKVEQKQAKPLIGLTLKNLKEAGTWVVDTLPKVPQTIDAITKIIDKIC